MRSRESLLAEIVDNPLPDPSVLSELKEYPWDCDKELVTITKAHICTVLAAFREKRLTAEQVRDWANRIEGRDDIGYELGWVRRCCKRSYILLGKPLYQLSYRWKHTCTDR